MSQNALPSSFNVCATCALWAGARSTEPTRTLSKFDNTTKGECLGGGFNRAQMNPLATCQQWQKWPAIK